MTLDEIKQKLDIDGLSLRISDNGEYLWANVERDRNGVTTSFSSRFPLDPKPHHFDELKEAVEQWWKEQE